MADVPAEAFAIVDEMPKCCSPALISSLSVLLWQVASGALHILRLAVWIFA